MATASDPIFALHKNAGSVAGRSGHRHRNAAHGRHYLPQKNHGRTSDPVVICSSLAEKGAQATFEALAAGAVSIITKPKIGLKNFLEDASNDIVQAVRSAARANLKALRSAAPPPGAGFGVSSAQALGRRDAERRR